MLAALSDETILLKVSLDLSFVSLSARERV